MSAVCVKTKTIRIIEVDDDGQDMCVYMSVPDDFAAEKEVRLVMAKLNAAGVRVRAERQTLEPLEF